MTLRTLQDSPVLAPLADAARWLGTEAILFGSVASRALLFDAAGAPANTLFELAEHISDIDIAHTGPASLTSEFEQFIAASVPMAPWFRWSVTDADGLARLEKLDQYNIGVPLRRLRLGTTPQGDAEATDDLLKRALNGDIDIVRNENFYGSARASEDTEASAVLLHIDAVIDTVDASLRSGRRATVQFEKTATAREILQAGLDRLATFAPEKRHPALRRLWYRLASFAVRISPQVFRDAVTAFALEPLLRQLNEAGYPASRFASGPGTSVLVSGYLRKGTFRVPTAMTEQVQFGDRAEGLASALEQMSTDGLKAMGEAESAQTSSADPIRLAPGNEVLAAVRSIPVHQGRLPSAPSAGPLAQDFVHLSLAVLPALGEVEAGRLTAVVVGSGRAGPVLAPAFASVSTALDWSTRDGLEQRGGPERCTVRVNLPGLPSEFDKIDVYLIRGAF